MNLMMGLKLTGMPVFPLAPEGSCFGSPGQATSGAAPRVKSEPRSLPPRPRETVEQSHRFLPGGMVVTIDKSEGAG